MNKRKLSFFVFVSLVLFTVSATFGAQVHLAWDASSGDVTGYRIYYGTSSGSHPTRVEVGNVTDYTVTGLNEGVTYYFVTRAYNQYGESGDSNEVPWQAEAIPPRDVTNKHEVNLNGTSLTLGWSNPKSKDGNGNTIYENIDFQGVMIRYNTGTTADFPADKNNGTLFGDKPGNLDQDDSFTGQITVGLIYKFSFFTHDYSGNYSSTAHLIVDTSPENHAPTISSFSVSPTALNNPLETATFTASAADQDGDSLTYSINFGDGSSATGQNVTHAYTSQGQYTVTLTVSDGNGGTATRQLTINVNDIPPAAPTGVSVE